MSALVRWDDTTRTCTEFDEAGAQTSQRPYTAEENARADADAVQATATANGDALRAKANAALTANATFLGLASPSNADVVAQTKALTRENNALIRLVLNKLDSTSGT